MKKGIAAKLKSRAGESIGETLVALLISSLALLMLAGAVSTASRVVTRSRRAMTDYYAESGVVEARTASEGTLRMILKDNSPSEPMASMSYTVNYYENDTIAGKPVIAYARAAS